MSQESVGKGNGGHLSKRPEWRPLHKLRELLRRGRSRARGPEDSGEDVWTFAPAFEVKENQDGYVFSADVPGLREQDLDVSTSGNRLVVCGRRDVEHEAQTEACYLQERSYGSFVRSFTLPEGADTAHIKAELEGGVLTIAVPRTAAAAPKKIKVQTGEDGAA